MNKIKDILNMYKSEPVRYWPCVFIAMIIANPLVWILKLMGKE